MSAVSAAETAVREEMSAVNKAEPAVRWERGSLIKDVQDLRSDPKSPLGTAAGPGPPGTQALRSSGNRGARECWNPFAELWRTDKGYSLALHKIGPWSISAKPGAELVGIVSADLDFIAVG